MNKLNVLTTINLFATLTVAALVIFDIGSFEIKLILTLIIVVVATSIAVIANKMRK